MGQDIPQHPIDEYSGLDAGRHSQSANTGRSVTSGGTTTVYDQIGRQTGTIRSR
jgi:hypothetical protein